MILAGYNVVIFQSDYHIYILFNFLEFNEMKKKKNNNPQLCKELYIKLIKIIFYILGGFYSEQI